MAKVQVHVQIESEAEFSLADTRALEGDIDALVGDAQRSPRALEEEPCPTEAMRACCSVRKGKNIPGRNGGACRLPSPSDYLFRMEWSEYMDSADRAACRTAWQALRGGGPCSELASLGTPAHLSLVSEAAANWKLAKLGNVLNGVIDCVRKKVHVLPQPHREGYYDQMAWSEADLHKVKGVPKSELEACYASSNCNHGHAVDAYVDMYGTRAQKQATPLAVTPEQFCTYERTTKREFLGFTLWADAHGTVQFMWNSKQLNGPNLDEPFLPDVEEGRLDGKTGAYGGTDGRMHRIGVLDDPSGGSELTNSIRVLFPNKPLNIIDHDLSTITRAIPATPSDVHTDALLGDPPFEQH